MAGKYEFLGYSLSRQTPTPPAIPPIEMSPFLQLEKDGANVTMLKFTSHTGTHLDVPQHVIEDGASLSAFGAHDFVFEHPMLVDLGLQDAEIVQPQHLAPFVQRCQDADFLLFRFGYGKVRETDPKRFTTKSPGFGVESAQYLNKHFPNVRGIGMDVPSLSCIEYLDTTMAAHNVLLGRKGRHFIVVEDMKLDLELAKLKRLIVAPLLVAGIDGGPCTVIGEFD